MSIPAYVVLDFQELSRDWGGGNAAEHKKNLFAFADEKIERGQLIQPDENWPYYQSFGSYLKGVDAPLIIVDKEKFGNQMMIFKATGKRKTFSYISRDSSS